MIKKIAMLTLTVLGLTVLAGCVKMDMEIEVKEDNTVSGVMIMAFDKSLEDEFGGGMVDEEEPDFPEGSEVEPYDDGDYKGWKATFKDVSLDEFMKDSEEDGLSLKREGDEFILEVTGEGSEDTGMAAAFMDSMKINLAFEFPGKIKESSGPVEVDGNRAVFGKESLFSDEAARVVASATPDSSGSGALIAVILLALLGVIGVGVWVFVVRPGKASEEGPVTKSEPSSEE